MNHIHAVLKLFHLAKVIFINKIPESRFISVRFFKFYQKFNILTKYLYTLDFRKAALHKAAFINFKHSIYNRDGWKWVLCQLYIVYLQLNGCRVHSFIYTHQALEQKSLTLALAIVVLHNLQRAIYCSHEK